jgi:hypothetical protein
MSGVAKRYNIPIVTGMQLNRGAYEKFESAIQAGNMDGIKKLGAMDAGESINVYENADCVVFQARIQPDWYDGMMLTIRRGKMRGKRPSNMDFFAQPFSKNDNGDVNEMRLVEDELLTKVYGTVNVGDRMAQEYDANAGATGTPPATRGTSRSAKVLQGGSKRGDTGPKKRNPPPIKEDSGYAYAEHIPDGDEPVPTGIEGLGLAGLAL